MPSLPLTSGGEAWLADAGEHSIPDPARVGVARIPPGQGRCSQTKTASARQHRGPSRPPSPDHGSFLPPSPFCAFQGPLNRSADLLRGTFRSIGEAARLPAYSPRPGLSIVRGSSQPKGTTWRDPFEGLPGFQLQPCLWGLGLSLRSSSLQRSRHSRSTSHWTCFVAVQFHPERIS